MNLRLSARLAPTGPSSTTAAPSRHPAPDPRLDQVESFMRQLVLADGVDRLSHMALDQIGSGGKRVRARLALAAADVFNVPKGAAIAWAASVELLHNATLIHDDIQDDDQVRRGRPTVWARHGVAQAINAGDFLLMLPYVALRDLPVDQQGKLALLLAETSTRIVRGQTCELDLLESGRIDSGSYHSAARGKTGALFELPVAGAAILGGLDPKSVLECASLFGRLGLSFQLQDDVLDLFGDKGKGQQGADVREGKVSAIIVELLGARPDLSEQVIAVLKKGRASTTDDDVQRIATLARENGALERVLKNLYGVLSEVESSQLCQELSGIQGLVQTLVTMIVEPLAELRVDEACAPSLEEVSSES